MILHITFVTHAAYKVHFAQQCNKDIWHMEDVSICGDSVTSTYILIFLHFYNYVDNTLLNLL